MPRDRPAAGGQDNTLDGEFPSDLSGGGGGGVTDKQTPLESRYVGDVVGGMFGGRQFVIQWDSRRIGGTRYGFYTTDTAGGTPFAQNSAFTNTYTSSAPITLTDTFNLNGDFVLGLLGSFTFKGATTSGTLDMNMDWSVDGLSQDLFTTVNAAGTPLGEAWQWNNVPNGGTIAHFFEPPIANPGLYVRYLQMRVDQYYYGNAPLQGAAQKPFKSPQIHPVGGSASFTVNFTATFSGPGFTNYDMSIRARGFNKTLLDGFSKIDYTT